MIIPVKISPFLQQAAQKFNTTILQRPGISGNAGAGYLPAAGRDVVVVPERLELPPITSQTMAPRLGLDEEAITPAETTRLLGHAIPFHELGHIRTQQRVARELPGLPRADVVDLILGGVVPSGNPAVLNFLDAIPQPVTATPLTPAPDLNVGERIRKMLAYLKQDERSQHVNYSLSPSESLADAFANYALRRVKDASTGQLPLDRQLQEELAMQSALLGRHRLVAEFPYQDVSVPRPVSQQEPMQRLLPNVDFRIQQLRWKPGSEFR